MKKILALFIVVIMALSLASCGSAYKKTVNWLYEDFPSRAGMEYNELQISAAKENISKNIALNGDILNIAHFPEADKNDVITFVYLYEFDLEEDAKLFYDTYAKHWKYAQIDGTVVIYGTHEILKDFSF